MMSDEDTGAEWILLVTGVSFTLHLAPLFPLIIPEFQNQRGEPYCEGLKAASKIAVDW